jgi:hypothetical protein
VIDSISPVILYTIYGAVIALYAINCLYSGSQALPMASLLTLINSRSHHYVSATRLGYVLSEVTYHLIIGGLESTFRTA